MSTSDFPVILVRAYRDRLGWFMAQGDVLLGHGVAESISDLRWVAQRAGILFVAFNVAVVRVDLAEEIAKRSPEWRYTTPAELARLDAFTLEVAAKKSAV